VQPKQNLINYFCAKQESFLSLIRSLLFFLFHGIDTKKRIAAEKLHMPMRNIFWLFLGGKEWEVKRKILITFYVFLTFSSPLFLLASLRCLSITKVEEK
jgi:hypothetical protein